MKRFLAYFAGCFVIGLTLWVDHTFGQPSIDQLLYHWHYSEGAAIDMSRIFVMTFAAEALAFPALFAGMAALASTALARVARGWAAKVGRALPVVVFCVGAIMLLHQFSVFSFIAAHFAEDEFGRRYVDPGQVQLQDRKLRNLVLVYAESLEESYGDASVFGHDLLAPLRTVGGTSYAAYRPAPGATWTMAGIVATQCGVPLRVYSEHDFRGASNRRAFLPGAVCLGDLLKARGYRNVFMGGAPLSFAGKGIFLRDHGYDERWGRTEWEADQLASEEVNEWGLYDEALFRRARARLQQLHASKQPFNLTLLTLDTHNPHGFLSPGCRREGARDFAGIVRCNSGLLAGLASFMKEHNYLEDTALVIIGDHLAVPNSLADQLARVADRRIFNLILAQPQPPRNTDELLPFDLFPTLVELLGIEVAGDRLGLGYSAIGSPNAPHPGVAQRRLVTESLVGSAAYKRLWQPIEHGSEVSASPMLGAH